MSVYGPLARYYDKLTKDVDYPGLYRYLTGHFRRAGLCPGTLADIACGTGSLSLLFAAAGVQTIGLDQSPEMLERAREKARACAGPAPRFVQGDMADFHLEEPVDGLVCMLDSFNYLLDPAEGVSALECFYRALAPGGMLIYDLRPRRQLMAFDGQMFLDETEDAFCLWRTEFDREENLCFYGIDLFSRQGALWQRQREEHYEYAYRLRWLKMQMARLGFRDIRFYGNRTMAPPGPEAERVFITARRP